MTITARITTARTIIMTKKVIAVTADAALTMRKLPADVADAVLMMRKLLADTRVAAAVAADAIQLRLSRARMLVRFAALTTREPSTTVHSLILHTTEASPFSLFAAQA